MQRKMTPFAAAAVIVLAAGAPARAQAPASGYRAEFLTVMGQVEGKFLALADAIPVAKYDWRPGEGVRSVCEVLMHVSVDKYLFGGPLGLKMPAALSGPNAEKCPANKADVKTHVKTAFAALNDAVKAMPDAAGDDPVTLFGMRTTKRGVLLMAAEHAGEHLGQQIAYARMNGVVPPWSR